ncbi:MAG: PSP1 domain-containing protein [Planctomycetota bacterium]
MGNIARLDCPQFSIFPRGTEVVCRTLRGHEVGEVICCIDQSNSGQLDSEGMILRRLGHEDELILERLNRFRNEAFGACQKLILQKGLPVVLVDVEHLFDGQSLYFYFLGDQGPDLEGLIQELAKTYEQKIQFKKFVENLVNGCGPGCGTDSAVGGCSSGACQTCAISKKCNASSNSQ